MRERTARVGGAVDVVRLRLDIGQQRDKLGLALRQPRLERLDIRHLAAQRRDQRDVIPVVEPRRQELADLIETEAGLLRGRDQFQHKHGFGRIGAVAVRAPIDGPEQAGALIEADTRIREARPFRQLTDIHRLRSLGKLLDLQLN